MIFCSSLTLPGQSLGLHVHEVASSDEGTAVQRRENTSMKWVTTRGISSFGRQRRDLDGEDISVDNENPPKAAALIPPSGLVCSRNDPDVTFRVRPSPTRFELPFLSTRSSFPCRLGGISPIIQE